MLKLSIIVPTYNRKEDLLRCLNSMLGHPDVRYEVVVIDDYSTDGTRELLDTLHAGNLKVLKNRQNRGVNFTRNRGIEAAAGEYVMFIDSDDKLLPGALEAVLGQIDAQRGVKHFLFYVTSNERNAQGNMPATVTYQEWLTESVAGDYTHVVQRQVMLDHPFFEQFRAYEYLNWLRVFKQTSPQVVVPQVITWVDTSRTDNLTKSLKLRSTGAIEGKFKSMACYFSLYGKDLYALAPGLYKQKFNHAVLLGLASYNKRETRRLVQESPLRSPLLTLLVNLSPAAAVNWLVRMKSARPA
ncbi:MAG: glycosyltransferase family 2 protein [Cytophagales bacterium]|nr:glycosyltransferase family 2 protein [Cytophagales bacterium]